MGFFDNLGAALSGEDEKIAQLRRKWLALIRRADAFGAQGKEGVSRGLLLCIDLCIETFPDSPAERESREAGEAGLDVYQGGATPEARASQPERDNFRRKLSLKSGMLQRGLIVEKQGLTDRQKEATEGWEVGIDIYLCGWDTKGLHSNKGGELKLEIHKDLHMRAFGEKSPL